ncbi:hypothetical protein ACWEQ7_08240 [Streptomyces sp. NPDC004069]
MTRTALPRIGPALCRGLVLAEAPDGLVVEGGPHRMLLGGEAVTGFLGELLPLLDGRHGPEELCARLAVEPTALADALELLDDWGVLESGGAEQEWAVPAETVTYYSRVAALTGGHRSADSVLEELSHAHVLLIADELSATDLEEDLIASGVGRVSRDGDAGRPEGYDLVVVAEQPYNEGSLEQWVSAVRHRGTPVLRLATGDGTVEVGPLFWPGESACVGCFRCAGGTTGTDGAPDAGQGLLVAAATMEVLAVLARTTPVTTLNTVVRTAVAGGRTESAVFAPEASCTECGDGDDRAVDDAVRLADAYEWHYAQPPRRLTPTPRTLAPRRQRLRTAAERRVLLPTSPWVELPDARAAAALGDTPEDGPHGAGTLGTLAALLPSAVGTNGPSQQGGPAPAAVAAYVLGEFGSSAPPGQVFRYDDIRHRLLSVRADTPVWRTALLPGGPGPEAAAPAAAIVLVADAGALAAEAGDEAWHAAHVAAGIAAMNLAAAAQEQEVQLSFRLGWSGGLSGILELDPTRQSVATVAALTGGREAGEVHR